MEKPHLQMEIPMKSFFKVNEVCSLAGIKPYVLRFWETEFDAIAPIVSASGQKLYGHGDLKAIDAIKKLLFDEKLTIEKAKFQVRDRMKEQDEMIPPEIPEESIHSLNPVQFHVEEKVEDNDLAEDEKVMDMVTSLSIRDEQKLILLKAKLSELISITQEIKTQRSWV